MCLSVRWRIIALRLTILSTYCMETSITRMQCTTAFYIQSPRLRRRILELAQRVLALRGE